MVRRVFSGLWSEATRCVLLLMGPLIPYLTCTGYLWTGNLTPAPTPNLDHTLSHQPHPTTKNSPRNYYLEPTSGIRLEVINQLPALYTKENTDRVKYIYVGA